MKFFRLFPLVAMLLGISATAQRPILSPTPQKITWGEELNITVDEMGLIEGLTIVRGVAGDEAVADYESKIPNKADGYYLKLSSEGVVLAGRDSRGLFYAEKTLQQLLGRDRTNAGHNTKVYAVEIEDYPNVPDRGVVEGFYGNPWSHQDRLRMFDFLADNKMNMYIYGPKDDPYHWNQWGTLYPAAELAQLKELVQYAASQNVKFVWAVHTGQSLTEAQYTQLYNKFEQLYNIGVRVFGMFYDDAYGNGAIQAEILNRMTEMFLNTHEGCEPFICCPAVYCGTFYGMGDGNYLPDMCSKTRQSNVKIMWTGSGVMDMQLGNSVQNFINSYGVKPFIWHNWPVNDYSRTHLFMGKTDGLNNRLYEKIEGFTANPMEFAEASKVTCYSVADYLWNMPAYDPDKSWAQAWQYLYPNHSDEFGLFCKNSVNPGSNRINRPGESSYFTAAMNAGVSATELFQNIYDAALTLLADNSDPAVSAEMEPWLRCMEITGHRGVLLGTLRQALDEQNSTQFIETYQLIQELEEEASHLESHTWYGGSGRICPTYGTLVLQPYINRTLGVLGQEFKNSGYEYPEGMFEPQVIENGVYYIKVNGMYLTNTGDNPELTGDRPTFTSTVDDIKPARQQWNISIDGETGRYKITSVADGRYVNEIGKFWANRTNNPYDSSWNTYYIFRSNGLHAIQNADKGGNNFWTVNGVNIEKGSSTDLTGSNFIFEIVPVDGEANYPVIESGKKYYIAYGNQLLTDMTSSQYPYFRSTFTKSWQLFKFTSVAAKDGRMKIETAKVGSSHSYINEIGNFGTNPYSDAWNTYIFIECDGKWAIRNAESGGNKYWTVVEDENGNYRLTPGGTSPEYLFEIGSDWQAFKDRVTPVEDVLATPERQAVYNLNGQRVERPAHGIYIVNGRKICY